MNIKSFNCSAVTLQLVAVLLLQQKFHNFATAFSVISYSPSTRHQRTTTVAVYSSPSPSDDDDDKDAIIDVTGTVAEPITKEEKDSAVGNLVVNDEWEGLTMELSDLIQTAVVEDMKKNCREFLGKEDYKLGDITKEVDTRVKGEIALLRGKEEYEVGDLIVVVDNMVKDMTEDLTGKPYEAGDLSIELDRRVKGAVAIYCGNEEYKFGDLSTEIDRRVKSRVSDYIGKDEYEFGDITKEIENKRRDWVKGYLGEDAAKDYVFGSITKKALTKFTGDDDYQFGDVSKKILGNIFGGKRKLK